MKKDGTLTKPERATMLRAFHIMQQWVMAHRMDDDEGHVDAIWEATKLLNKHMYTMLFEEDD